MSLALDIGSRVQAGYNPPWRGADRAPPPPPGAGKATAAPRFDAGDLYGKGAPSACDIKQDALGDCYFVATMGALANKRPDLIQNAIRYDANTGTYQVRLYQDGKPVTVTVTQSELAYNLNRQGGSTVDNTGRDQRVWPAVIETAYAKQLDSNPADGLKEGFDILGGGGKARDALEVLTGDKGTDYSFSRGFFESRGDALSRLGQQAQTALANGRPLTLSTDPENRSLWQHITGDQGKQDGLVDNHVYVVESVTKVGDDYQVTLRNPWGTNQGVGEGKDSTSATITVSLSELVETGGLEYFNAGPAN